MFIKGTQEVIEDYIEEIYDNGVVLSNYFSLDLVNIEYIKTEFSIVLKKEFTGFSRIYFLTNNIDDLKTLLHKISDVSVINYPTRDDTKIFNDLMLYSGYKLYRVYEEYFNTAIKGNDIFIEQFATEQDINRVKELLYSKLNVYTDHLPDDSELMNMIQNKQVLVNYENNELCGAFIYTLLGKKCYFNFWVDNGENGLFLIFNMYNYLKQINISYSYLWVDTENEKVKRIHKLFGSKPNSSKDYIYIKQ